MLRPDLNRAHAHSKFSSRRLYISVFLCVCVLTFYAILAPSSDDEVLYESYGSTRYSIEEMQSFALKNSISTDFKPTNYNKWNFSFSRMLEDPNNRFNIEGSDVIVFVHIQKTAGTSFEKFLVKYLQLTRPCQCNTGRKRCICKRPNNSNETWLFSRYSTGWICGLHADYTELSVNGCVDASLDKKEGARKKRRYFYTTFVREPIARFISEFRHVNRGATWMASRHICNGRAPTPDELPLCFDPQLGWDDVELDEFLHCPYNLGFNRQTRMLADLTLVNCYSHSGMDSNTRDRIMLESAKHNLEKMAFFGIKERMDDSQFMFEQLFDLRFSMKLGNWTRSKSNDTILTEAQMHLIRDRNRLDIELYQFAVQLFNERLDLLKQRIIPLPSNKSQGKPNDVVYFLRESDKNKTYYDSEDSSSEDDPVDHLQDEKVLFRRVP